MTQCLLQGKKFFCREWTFSKLNHCLENRPTSKTGGALIMGGPGCGKTAVCCEVVWPSTHGKQKSLTKRVLAYHFCQAHDIETLSITRFIHSLVKQLKKSHLIEGYREKLQDPAIRRCLDVRECEKNPDDAFKQAIINPLLTIKAPSQNLMLLVDSIDESYFQYINDRLQSSRTIAELLANHHNMLPRWLLLVCSSRKQSKSVTRLFTGFRKISLDDLRKSHVVRDVQQYILCRLDQEEDLRQHLSRETAEMLNQLHIKSNGCFLYLEKVLDGVADSFIILREIRDIPGTLNGLYLWLCQRLFLRKQFAKIQPILNAILAARKPLSESELYLSLQTRNNTLSREEFNRRLKLLSKILIDGKDGSKILFHHSFAEWLLDVKHCTQKYLCNASEGHGILAMYATLNAPNLTPEEVQDFALHLERTSTQVPVNHNCLVQWLLLSGANVEDSLLPGIPKDSKVLKLLVDAGAKMPTEEEDIQSISASMSALNDIPDSDNEKSFIELEVPLGQLDSSGRTLLHTAAYHGNLQMVSYLISKEANIEAADKSGQTPLNLAARQGHPDVVAELLHAGSDVNHADNDGWTALRSASWGGHTDVVSLLLDEKVEVDHTDSDQRTALRAAAWGGHEEIVIQLLKQGADSNKVDNEGRTALIAAAYMGHVEIVEHLLDFNASIDHEDRDGRTALSVAALCIPASVGHEKVVSLLLERGAEVDHQDHDGMTPLLVAAYEGHKDVCELLLEWDADIDHSDHNNRSPLLAAASMGHADVVGQLLFWNAAVDTIDAEGRTVLSIAAAQGNVAVVQQLLDRGLDEMHKDNAGWMPLHMAAFEGHSQVCEILMEQGAKVNELDNDGRSPLILAAQEGHLSVTQTLVEHCAHLDHKAHDGRTPFRSSCLENHKELADYLLSEGANINYKDPDGRSTLYVVVLENKLEMAKFLLEKGAVVDGTDLEGRTGLHVASWQGLFEMAEQLIIYGADVNAEDNDKRTALQSAAWQGHANVVRLLLEKGAKVDHTCNQGATALCIAAQEGHDQVVKVLLQFHANPNHADQFGRTPIRVAYKSGHSAVCKLLEHYGANPVNGAKSRSGSSTSSNDTKSSGYIAGSTAVNIVDRNPLHSSPSDSPDSTSDRRKSYVSNNSSTGRSSSLTTSTNQSSHGLQIKFDPDNCLTFTQQLQQCSMSRNRSRPVSRVLSPVSEPQSPVQSPITSPIIESHGITGFIKPSPHNDNILTPSPVKYSSIKQEKISATINIITNPNAELPYSNDEPIWQINPAYFKNNLARLELQRKNNTDMSNKTVMGQRAATEPRSPPEMRRKRNGIVTNPKVINKSPGMNGHYNKLTTNGGGDSAMINTNGITTNNITLTNNITNGHKTPVRPNGLPLKKETPL